ncbi:hypothetical protein RHGRI_007483 [Rhododendron griersonianum]|uniref:Uncharacterized protein n=1 Tax=Rhododendron griersonianum TaxID=479676 RepID=A0AAV6KYW6_9ERIC|nr:hypothetical protein RHGRI_007483 [Rhododendron griersonianum]
MQLPMMALVFTVTRPSYHLLRDLTVTSSVEKVSDGVEVNHWRRELRSGCGEDIVLGVWFWALTVAGVSCRMMAIWSEFSGVGGGGEGCVVIVKGWVKEGEVVETGEGREKWGRGREARRERRALILYKTLGLPMENSVSISYPGFSGGGSGTNTGSSGNGAGSSSGGDGDGDYFGMIFGSGAPPTALCTTTTTILLSLLIILTLCISTNRDALLLLLQLS